MNTNLEGLKNTKVDVEERKYDCIDIVKLDDGYVNENKEEKPLAFTIPFCSLFLGPSRSGKSTTWINMLKNKDLLYGRFDEVYYFIPTWNEDPIYDKNLLVDPKYICLDYDPLFTKRIIDEKKTFVENHLARPENLNKSSDGILPPCLFIVDDNVGTKELSSRMFTILDMLATRGRKYNISLIIAAQYLEGVVSTIVRANLTDICLYFIPNTERLKRALLEFKGTVSLPEARAMYNCCFEGGEKSKHNFLYIQNFNVNKNTKFRKNLNTFLIATTSEKQRLLPLKRKQENNVVVQENKKTKLETQEPVKKENDSKTKKEMKEEEQTKRLLGIKKKHMNEFLESRRYFIEKWVDTSYKSGYVDDISLEDWDRNNPELHLLITPDKLKTIDETFLRNYVRTFVDNYENDKFFVDGLSRFLINGPYDKYEHDHKKYDTHVKVFDKVKKEYDDNEVLNENYKYSNLPFVHKYIPQLHSTNQSELEDNIYSKWLSKEELLTLHNRKEAVDDFLDIYNPNVL